MAGLPGEMQPDIIAHFACPGKTIRVVFPDEQTQRELTPIISKSIKGFSDHKNFILYLDYTKLTLELSAIILKILEQIPDLKCFGIIKMRLCRDEAENLSNLLQKVPNIEQLLLHIISADEDFNDLIQQWPVLHKVKALEIIGAYNSFVTKILLEWCKKDTADNIRELNFYGGYCLEYDKIKFLAQVIKSFRNLQMLKLIDAIDLSILDIGDLKSAAILDLMSNLSNLSSLKDLNISSKGINSKHIASLVAKMPSSIHTLIINGVRLDDDIFKLFIAALLGNLRELRVLEINAQELTEEFIKALPRTRIKTLYAHSLPKNLEPVLRETLPITQISFIELHNGKLPTILCELISINSNCDKNAQTNMALVLACRRRYPALFLPLEIWQLVNEARKNLYQGDAANVNARFSRPN